MDLEELSTNLDKTIWEKCLKNREKLANIFAEQTTITDIFNIKYCSRNIINTTASDLDWSERKENRKRFYQKQHQLSAISRAEKGKSNIKDLEPILKELNLNNTEGTNEDSGYLSITNSSQSTSYSSQNSSMFKDYSRDVTVNQSKVENDVMTDYFELAPIGEGGTILLVTKKKYKCHLCRKVCDSEARLSRHITNK